VALSRRDFIKHGQMLLGAFAVALAPVSLAGRPSSRAYYRLSATAPSEAKCRACRSHAQYKLFASAAAADAARAHAYCQCEIVPGGTLPLETWTSLFGQSATPSVDLRWANVQSALNA
jgi:hypothetical protein